MHVCVHVFGCSSGVCTHGYARGGTCAAGAIRSSVLINTKPSLTQGLEGQCSWLNPDLLPNLRSHQNSIPNGTSS